MSLASRRLTTTFALGTGAFGESGTNTVALSNLRTSAKIVKAGGRAMSTAQITVYGMTFSQMNALSTLGMIATTKRRNSVTVAAGDVSGTPTTVFQGTITNAWPDFQAAPEVAFQVEAHTGLLDALAPTTPISYRGSAAAADLLSGLAVLMGLAFENNGVTAQIANPYFPGTPRVQAQAIVDAAGISWNGGDGGVLSVWNPGSFRGGSAPLVSPATGMIGYPAFNGQGVMLKTVFNPSIGLGGKIVVESSLPAASGTWGVYAIDHDLDGLLPRGRWESTIQAAPVGLAVVP